MEQALGQVLTLTFEGHAQKYEGGMDLVLARDLQQPLRCQELPNSFAFL